MKRKLMVSAAVLIALLGTIYILAEHTSRGRVVSLYAFGAIKAPLVTKIACASDTDARVTEKFKQPLNFDPASKTALREYWHFSYYRECLFKAGYDFYGNKILASTLSSVDSETSRYTNHFGNISFTVPAGTTIKADNITNPDMDDYVITSILKIGEYDVIVQFDRSKKEAVDLAEINDTFTGFSTTTAAIVNKSTATNQSGSVIMSVHQDDATFGLLSFTPEHLVVSIYGEKLPIEILNQIESSFTFVTP